MPLPFVPFSDALHLNASQLSASATQLVGRFQENPAGASRHPGSGGQHHGAPVPAARTQPRARRQEGQVLVLGIGFILIALLVATVVMAASSVYLEHKKLLSLADGASVAAADSFTLGQLGNAGGTPSAVLSGARVQRRRRLSGPQRRVRPLQRPDRGAVHGQPGRCHRRRGAERGRPPAGGELPGAGRHPDRGDVDGAVPPQPLSCPITPAPKHSVALSVDAAKQAFRQPKVIGQPAAGASGRVRGLGHIA